MIEQYEQQEDRPRKRIRELSPEELRAYKRASMEKSRKKKRAEEENAAANEGANTREEFWALQRAQLTPEQREEFEALGSLVGDLHAWMTYGAYLPEDDPDYIPFDEAFADLINFVRKHPCVHGWNFWGTEKYWTSAATMAAIKAEGCATETWARYGYWVGLEDCTVSYFLTETLPKLGHKPWDGNVPQLLGFTLDGNNTICYSKNK